jgi:hypothetical protein
VLGDHRGHGGGAAAGQRDLFHRLADLVIKARMASMAAKVSAS